MKPAFILQARMSIRNGITVGIVNCKLIHLRHS